MVGQRTKVPSSSFILPENAVDYSTLAHAIYFADKSFQTFLSGREVNESDYKGAVDWVNAEFNLSMEEDRWWGKESLQAIPSIGTSLSFGIMTELSKFGRSIRRDIFFHSIDIKNKFRNKEILQLENALLRASEANAIVVDNDEGVARDIVLRLDKKIYLGQVHPLLEHKNIIEFDWPLLVSLNKDKARLQEEMFKLLRECENTGNVILYIANLHSFILDCKNAGINIQSVMEECLASPGIHVIAHSTKTDFYYFMELFPGLGKLFERVVPEEETVLSSMPPILEKAKLLETESKGKIFFTYPALAEVAELSDKFVAYGEMPGKALHLMEEVFTWGMQNNLFSLSRNDVSSFISEKMGLGVGAVSTKEGEKLSRLEELLHERIVGQEEAVKAVSSAMRRSRAGIGNPKRPIATFLFLGPTGVGKTETAKALAESFFGPPAGGENKIIRFDMSEYNGADALPRLIGSFSEGKIGDLSAKLHDNPYGVVLLDEFEKAAPDVHNLFLRILDEGKFTDAFQGEVSARNVIFIATSNAGSDMIWNIVREGKDIAASKDAIVDSLVEQHILKPELINRFDGVVLFKPLETLELRSVADKIFEKFAKRLREEKQIEIKLSSELLDYLVLHGADKEFGARSINRIMQEKIEDYVARKILSKEVRAGQTLELGVRDVM